MRAARLTSSSVIVSTTMDRSFFEAFSSSVPSSHVVDRFYQVFWKQCSELRRKQSSGESFRIKPLCQILSRNRFRYTLNDKSSRNLRCQDLRSGTFLDCRSRLFQFCVFLQGFPFDGLLRYLPGVECFIVVGTSRCNVNVFREAASEITVLVFRANGQVVL